MEIPEVLNDPRFLEVVRELRELIRKKEAPPPSDETPEDEATRRVKAKINLRMKQRKAKR